MTAENKALTFQFHSAQFPDDARRSTVIRRFPDFHIRELFCETGQSIRWDAAGLRRGRIPTVCGKSSIFGLIFEVVPGEEDQTGWAETVLMSGHRNEGHFES